MRLEGTAVGPSRPESFPAALPLRTSHNRLRTSHNRRVTLILGLAALVLGCDIFEDAKVSFRFLRSDVPGVDQGGLVIRFSDGSGRRVVRGRDFRVTGEDGTPHSPRLSTPRSGTLTIEVLLQSSSGEPVSGGILELDLRSDWIWGVNVAVSDRNPALDCLGCFGVLGFPLAPAVARTSADSLFVTWGGNSISNPVTF